MPDRLELREAALPALAGSPGLTQGRYGSRGNLELLVPDVVRGAWVLWWNADDPGAAEPAVDAAPGAVPGAWSGALHVPAPQRLRAVSIAQVRPGPDHLEALLAHDGGVERWSWTPDHGFAWRGAVHDGPADRACLVEDGDRLFAICSGPAGAAVRVADLRGHPELTWSPLDLGLGDARHAAAEAGDDGLLVAAAVGDRVRVSGPAGTSDSEPSGADVLDVAVAGGQVLALTPGGLAHVTPGGRVRVVVPGPWDAIAACRSAVDRPRLEVVLRAVSQLWHLRLDLAHDLADPMSWTKAVPVRSRVRWASDAPVHRR